MIVSPTARPSPRPLSAAWQGAALPPPQTPNQHAPAGCFVWAVRERCADLGVPGDSLHGQEGMIDYGTLMDLALQVKSVKMRCLGPGGVTVCDSNALRHPGHMTRDNEPPLARVECPFPIAPPLSHPGADGGVCGTQRCKTAREAIKFIDAITKQYGYASSGDLQPSRGHACCAPPLALLDVSMQIQSGCQHV